MAKLSVGVSKAFRVWRQVSEAATRPAGIILAGNSRLVAAARERFAAGGFVPAEWSFSIERLAHSAFPAEDLLLLFVTPDEEAAATSALAARNPRGGAIIAVEEVPGTGRTCFVGLRCRRVSFADNYAGWQRLYQACIQAAGERAVALAKRYPVLRDSAARYTISRAALQGAALGFASFLRGAQAPALAAVQLSTVLTLATLYGQALNQERAPELAAVVAASLGQRRLSCFLERRLPEISWLARSAVAGLITLAAGLAALCYYRKGAPWSTSRLISLLSSLKR